MKMAETLQNYITQIQKQESLADIFVAGFTVANTALCIASYADVL